MKDNRKAAFWLLAFAAGIGIGVLEVLVVVLETVLTGNDFSGVVPAGQMMAHWLITCTVWTLLSILLIRIAKKKGLQIWAFRDKPAPLAVIAILIFIVVTTAVNFVSWEFTLKTVGEYQIKTANYPDAGMIILVWQYIYYLFEVWLMYLCISYAQYAGELTFGSSKIPWGGIFLGITWGILHGINKGWVTGLELAAVSVLYGLAYIVLRKNIRYAYFAVWLMFVL